MKYVSLVEKVSHLPAFTIRFLAAGEDLNRIRVQINRWVRDGKVIRIHKGLYTLAEPYRKVNPHPFYIANMLKKASYVSLQSALSWYGLIPEFVPSFTSITTGRPQSMDTPLGRFDFRHVSKKYFWGYEQHKLSNGIHAFIASPEKALLDLIYLTPGGEKKAFIEELRLQNVKQIDTSKLTLWTQRFHSAKMMQAEQHIQDLIAQGDGIDL
ncbi:hypothetical protein [Fidelibacter multiformis]|jgi:predicted transcriptional regulator of viral defense system|uniref:type IV toxin-antitoxin system AbiEi family antitoxin domain-containing protein n=1 Tax=Fidelibacter multiformis TaxID=3377529 RepID=UPI0037DC1EC0